MDCDDKNVRLKAAIASTKAQNVDEFRDQFLKLNQQLEEASQHNNLLQQQLNDLRAAGLQIILALEPPKLYLLPS